MSGGVRVGGGEDIFSEDIFSEDIFSEDIFSEDIFSEDIFSEDIFCEDIFTALLVARSSIARVLRNMLVVRRQQCTQGMALVAGNGFDDEAPIGSEIKELPRLAL
jgi:hypothetical protein